MSTKEKILRAAVELFSEKGFAGTTTRDICAKAECNIAAVNYHFKGKKGLGSAVVDYLFKDYDERHSSFLDAPLPRSESEWREMMVGFVRNFISGSEDEFRTSSRMRIIFSELSNPTVLFHEMHARFMKPIQERLRVLIRIGLADDATDSEVNMWLMTLMSQCVFFRKKHPPEMGLAEIDLDDPRNVDAVARHIAATLSAP
jgi:AcrR family transcriptional regulator